MFNFSQSTQKVIGLIKNTKFKFTKRIIIAFVLLWLIKFALVLFVFAASAETIEPNQVKCKGESTVYYLDYSKKIKKPYLNEKAFLSYGNRWSDVRTIDCKKIANWDYPELIKLKNSQDVYAVNGDQKILLGNMTAAVKKGYDPKSVLTLSKVDFNSYVSSVSYFWSGEKAVVEAELIPVNKSVKKVVQGSEKQRIMSLKIQEVSGNENIVVKKIVFAQVAQANIKVLDNIALKNKNNKNIPYRSTVVNNRLIIEFENGYVINKNNYDTFNLYASFNYLDSGDLQLNVAKEDIAIAGERSKQPLILNNVINYSVKSNCNTNCDRFMISNAIVVVKNSDTSSKSTVYRGQKDAELGNFEISNNGENIYIEQIKVRIAVNNNAKELSNKVNLVNDNNDKILATLNGQNLDNRDAYFTLPVNYLLKSKNKFKISITSTINTDIQTGENYQVYVKEIVVRTTNNQRITYTSDAKGNVKNVSKPALHVFTGDFTAKDILVAGKKKAKIASYKITANNDSGAKIKSLKFNKAAGFASINYSNGFENLVLYKNDSPVSNVIKEPNSQNYSFDNLNITVEPGKTVDISLRADISENATGQVSTVLDNAKAVSKDQKANVEVYNDSVQSISPEIIRNTVYISSLNGGSADNNTKNNLLASFKISTQSAEDIKLKNATIETMDCDGGLNTENGFKNLKFGYIDDKGKIKFIGSTISSPSAYTNKLSLNGFTIKQNSNTDLNLYADTGSKNVQCVFTLRITNLEAEGVSTKVKTYVEGYPTASVNITLTNNNTASNTNSNTGTSNSGSSNSSTNTVKVKFTWPTNSHTVYYKFHDPSYPYVSEMQHEGIDLKASQGTTIRAAANGRVVTAYAGNMNDASYVVIEHNGGYTSVYGHLSVVSIKVGQEVKAGDTIGKSGGTPGTIGAGQYSTGPHLHFEIRLNNAPIDPLKYLTY